ncbi:MAG: ShlB/FhaC/HecB family hemolysin secretion/activation protein [Vitreimonas sp.]
MQRSTQLFARWVVFGASILFPLEANARIASTDAPLRGLSDPARADLITCVDGSGSCVTLVAASIDGASVFSAAELSSSYVQYLARPVSADDVARIADAITHRYRDAGYFLSRAVVARFGDDGVAQISVFEGRISDFTIEGSGAGQVRRFMRGFDTRAPARLADLDRRLALAADTPGLSLQSRIEPDPEDLTRHRLIITATLRPITISAAFDNHGSESVGPWQGSVRVAANSLLREGDQAGLAVYTTPLSTDEFSSAEAFYSLRFANGARLGATIAASRAHDGNENASFGADGDARAAGVILELPLLRRRNRGLWVSGAFDALHIERDWTSGGYEDDLRVARLALRGLLNEQGSSTTVFVQTSFGLDVLGASGASATRRSRIDADARFAKVDFHLAHYRDLGAHFGLYVSVDGQWTNEPLLLSEEFELGGLPYGRAYRYGEISGDRGIAGSIELRAGFDPELDPISFVQGYAFVDAGQVWNLGPDPYSNALASSGVGLRVTLNEHVRAGFELARPLTRTPDDADDHDWRQFFSVSAWY